MSSQTFEQSSSRTFSVFHVSSHRYRSLFRFISDPAAGFSIVVIAIVIGGAAIAPLWTPHDPNSVDAASRAVGPSFQHPAGTDVLGRDVLSRLMVGARPTLQVGLIAVSLACLVGVSIGLGCGYWGGWVDSVGMRVMDTVYAFPALILVLGLVAVLGRGIAPIGMAIAVVNVPVFARVTRAQVLTVRTRDFVRAAEAVGASPLRVLVRHIAPNSWAPVLVQATVLVGYAILIEASLSFLGLSVPPPAPTWGGMLEAGFRYINQHPLLSVTPGIAIFVVVLACNLLGDALRDFLDPRVRKV